MFDTERFISEIEKRPAIYNTNCDEYNDRTAKLAAWDEVCQVMIRNWPTLSDEERIVEGNKKKKGKKCARSTQRYKRKSHLREYSIPAVWLYGILKII